MAVVEAHEPSGPISQAKPRPSPIAGADASAQLGWWAAALALTSALTSAKVTKG